MSDDHSPALDALFAEEENRPAEVELPDGASIDTKQFHDALDKLARAARSLDGLADDLDALRETGLKDSDVIDLLYGRNTSLRKSDLVAILQALDAVREAIEENGQSPNRERLLVILIAQIARANFSTVKEVFAELRSLQEQYG